MTRTFERDLEANLPIVSQCGCDTHAELVAILECLKSIEKLLEKGVALKEKQLAEDTTMPYTPLPTWQPSPSDNQSTYAMSEPKWICLTCNSGAKPDYHFTRGSHVRGKEIT